jgi:large subunit ribosomal protein L3
LEFIWDLDIELWNLNMSGILGKKLGMTQIFDEKGKSVPVTVIEAGPCYIAQIKTVENDGYDAIQLGFVEKKDKAVNKPLSGHFVKSGIKPAKYLREFKGFDISKLKLGDEIKADIFSSGEFVNIVGISKGLGFQGVVRRHHFSGGPITHGQSDRVKAPGSVGPSSYPSRTFKGQRMAGRMGGDRVTVRNLKIVKIDIGNNLILVKGAIPGKKNSIVEIKKK